MMPLHARPLFILLLTMALLLSLAGQAPSSTRVSAAPALTKKACKTVTKKVHGKKKRVRVCKTVKSKPAPAPTATPTATSLPSLPTAPDPLTVGVHSDPSHAASADIPTAGGTLSATAADGTKFTLTIPSGALLSTTTITMTPVTSLDGLPFSGGLVGAVQLGPEGLQLMKSATLTIGPPQAPAPGKQVSFMAEGSGQNFHLYPEALSSSQITLQLVHFSTPGVTRATPEEIVAAMQRMPAGLEAQFEQLQGALELTHEAESAGLHGPYSSQDLQQMEIGFMADRLDQQIIPNLQNAASGNLPLEGIDAAVAAALGAERQLQITNLAADPTFAPRLDTIHQLLDKLGPIIQQKVLDQCRAHDLTAVYRLLGIERQVQLTGGDVAQSLTNLESGLDTCLRFKLDFDMGFKQDYSYASGFVQGERHESWHFTTQGLELRLQGDFLGGQGSLSGQGVPGFSGSGDNSSVGTPYPGCTYHEDQRWGAPVQVLEPFTASLTFLWPQTAPGQQGQLPPPNPELAIRIGKIQLTEKDHTDHCAGPSTDTTFTAYDAHVADHFADFAPSICAGGDRDAGQGLPCLITSWDSNGNGVWAMDRTYTEPAQQGPDSAAQLTLNITLAHTPG